QPFAKTDTCAAGWWLVHRAPLRSTCNLTYRAQDAALGALASAPPTRRSAVEIAYDVLLWARVHDERLLATTWDWSRTETADQALVALGEHGPEGLHVIAYSRAVRFDPLGVCPQR